MTKNTILNFEDGTRRRTMLLDTIPFVDGQARTIDLPRVGYLSRIRLQTFIQVQATGGTAFVGDALIQGARAALPRIVFETNTQANIVNSSAHGLNLLSYTESPGHYSSDQLTDEQTGPITAAGTPAWFFETIVPIALNDGPNYQIGLLNTQNDDVTAKLRIEHAPVRSLVADGSVITGVTGYTMVEIEYYEVPDAAQYLQPPLNNIIQITESIDSVTIGTGEHVYPIPRGNMLLSIIHQLTEGSEGVTFVSPINPSGRLDTYELRMQGSVTDARSKAFFKSHEDRRRYGRALPTGTVVNDFAWDMARVGEFNLGYQILDTQQFTRLEAIFGVQGLNSNTAKLRTIRREIVRLY